MSQKNVNLYLYGSYKIKLQKSWIPVKLWVTVEDVKKGNKHLKTLIEDHANRTNIPGTVLKVRIDKVKHV